MPSDSSRSLRIKILLLIDTAFFFLELIVGYSVGSLALVADSFHMLNDVCSLLVALYAIKLAKDSKRSHEYSYGWQRAEVLGALVNGVFLISLCFSIFIEAIQRVFEPISISHPPLVVLVGSLGLASNIVGLLLFHEHGHSHGGAHSHSHSHSHAHSHSHTHSNSKHLPSSSSAIKHAPHPQGSIESTPQTGLVNERSPLMLSTSIPPSSSLSRQPSSNSVSSYNSTSPDMGTLTSGQRPSPMDEICVHPAQTRNNIMRAAELQRDQLSHRHHTHSDHPAQSKTDRTVHPRETPQATDDLEFSHSHNHHHSHANMNMRAIFLHALGDALGNVGVIVTGLLIWLVPKITRGGSSVGNGWILYADPAISLMITGIIFTSAIPLVRSASLILLQGTPSHVDLGRVQKSIQSIKGVLQVHELHIWSLSELKLVASVHVLIENQDKFATISRQIRKCLHHYGIHSSTIQPEVLLEEQVNILRAKSLINSAVSSAHPSPMVTSGDLPDLVDADGCLAQCDEACAQEACCPPGSLLPMTSSANSRASRAST